MVDMARRTLRRDDLSVLRRNRLRSTRSRHRPCRFVLHIPMTLEAPIEVRQQEILGACRPARGVTRLARAISG